MSLNNNIDSKANSIHAWSLICIDITRKRWSDAENNTLFLNCYIGYNQSLILEQGIGDPWDICWISLTIPLSLHVMRASNFLRPQIQDPRSEIMDFTNSGLRISHF
jgi:hypothetical protein